VLTVLLGVFAQNSTARFILQTKTDGPVRMLVVDYPKSGTGTRPAAQFDPGRSRRPPRPSRRASCSAAAISPLTNRPRARK